MSTTLAEVQKELVARGVQDVKFTWAPNALKDYTAAELATEAARALQLYLDGDYEEMDLIGDSADV